MTDQIANEAVSQMKGYFGLKYGTYQNFENDLILQIQSQNLTAEQQAVLVSYIQAEQPHKQFFMPDVTDNLREFMLDTYLTGTGEFLQWYGQQGKTFVTQTQSIIAVQRTTSIGTSLDIVFAESLSVTSTTFPAVSALGKAMARAALPIGFGIAAYEVYNSPTPDIEGLKQSSMLLGTAFVTGLVGLAMAPTYPAVATFAAAAAVGLMVNIGIEAVWDYLPALVENAKAAGKTALETAQIVADALSQQALSVFDAVGAEAEQFLNGASHLMDKFIDSIPEMGTELPSWLKTDQQLQSELGIPDINIAKIFPGNEWIQQRETILSNGTSIYALRNNDVLFRPSSSENPMPDTNKPAYSLGIGFKFGDSAPTGMGYSFYNSEGNLINGPPTNTYLDFNTNFRGSLNNSSNHSPQDWQNGTAIGGSNYNGSMPSGTLNGNGYNNVIPSGIVTDHFRPGAGWLGASEAFLDNLFRTTSLLISNNLSSNFLSPVTSLTSLLVSAMLLRNIDPLVLDMDGDGVELISFDNSYALFDVDNDGFAESTGWVNKDDALLVHDINGDGIINNITETVSEYYGVAAGAAALYEDGLDALAALDSNADRVFNQNDAAFSTLRVWRDVNENGLTEAGELITLATAGIQSIDLTREITTRTELEGNPVLSQSTMMINGVERQVAAVDFTTNTVGYEWNEIAEGLRVLSENGEGAVLQVQDISGVTIDLSVLNSDGTSANDADVIVGNIGDDILIGDAGNNWLMGGKGQDTLQAGAGDDLLVVDADDDMENIDAGSGFDIIQVADNRGVVINLHDVHAEVGIGGDGDDTFFSGSTTNVFVQGGGGNDAIIGGSADDALSGEDGDDFIDGGLGDDVLRGHRGEDRIIGNAGEDMLDGGLDDDQLYAGDDDDLLIGGGGNDRLYGGADYDVAQYSGAFNEYEITVQPDGSVKVRDKIIGRDGTDILKDVEALNFKNMNEVRIDHQGPMIANDIVSVSGAGPYIISASNVLSNDVDFQGQIIHIKNVSNAVGGTVSLDGNGNVVFTPDASYRGVRSFTYTAADSQNNTSSVLDSGTGNTADMKGVVHLKEPGQPDDPLFFKEWYLSDTNVIPVWKDYTGKGVKIGVFESQGIMDKQHADLIDNLSQETLDSSENANWHATLVSGVIAADKNGIGGVGVAYDSELTGIHQDFANDVDALNYFKFDVVNNSWGWVEPFMDNFHEFPDSETFIFNYAAQFGRDGLGTVMVFAGGNERAEGGHSNVNSWSNNPFVITVGGINKANDLGALELYQAPFSNAGSNLLISAPASHIEASSLIIENSNGSTFGEDYAISQGTSFATPIVTGIIALMLEANPNLGYRDIQEILAFSARKVNDPNTVWQTNGAMNWNGGGMHFSHDYGFGNVDALAAVRLAETWHKQETVFNQITPTNPYVGNVLNQIIPDGGTLTSTVVVNAAGQGQLEYVQVTLNFVHPQVGDLIVELISPSGTKSILLNRLEKAPDDAVDRGHGAEDMTFTFGSWAHMGEMSQGTWTLKVTDAVGGAVGTLRNWELDFTEQLQDYYQGDLPPANSTYVYTNEYLTLTDVSRQILQEPSQSSMYEDDTLNVAAITGDVNINLAPGSVSTLGGKNLTIAANTYIDRVFTGDGNDTVTGNAENNLLYGGRGNDILNGGAGNDWLMGKDGTNTLAGGANADRFVLQKGDVGTTTVQDFSIAQGDKVAILNYLGVSSINDLTLIQQGSNTLITAPDGAQMILTGVTPSMLNNSHFIFDSEFSLHLLRLEEVTYTNGDDNVWFGNVFNGAVMYGLDGNDFIRGSFGDDTIYGGAGNDTLVGSYDTYNGWSNATEVGGGEDILYGGDGDDKLYGSGMRDTMIGGAGSDLMVGNKGSDIIHIEGGFDRAYGNEGADRFIIHKATQANILLGNQQHMDMIFDFDVAKEQIDLRAFANIRSFHDLNFDTGSINIIDPVTGQSVPTPYVSVFLDEAATDGQGTTRYQYFTLMGIQNSSSLSEDDFIFNSNILPQPQSDSFTLNEDSSFSFSSSGLLANDIAGEGGVVVFNKIVDGPMHGTLVNNGSGNFIYTPNANYFGTDRFTYEVKDADGATATSTAFLNVNPVNDAPLLTSSSDTWTARTGTFFSFTPNYVDVDGNSLSYALTLQGGGTLPSWLTFDPSTGKISGTAPLLPQTITFDVQANDDATTSNHSFTLQVQSRTPDAKDDGFTGEQDQIITGNVLSDHGHGVDSDPDGDVLSVQAGVYTTAQNGTITLLTNGNFTYTPPSGLIGSDSFEYTLLDAHGGSDKASINFILEQSNANEVPVISNHGGSVSEDGVLVLTTANLNATDVDNTASELVFTITAATAHGVLKLGSNVLGVSSSFTLQDIIAGNISFTPTANFNGNDGFSFALSDGFNDLGVQTFPITVSAVNDAPVAQNDGFSTNEDQTLVGNVLANNGNGIDSDADNDVLTVNAGTFATSHGSVTIAANGSFTYMHAANYNGTDSFTYQISDGYGGSSSATVNINIAAVNDAPVARNDNFTTNEDTAVTGNVLSNNGNGADSDVENNVLTVQAGTFATAHGSITINSSGNFVYTPAANYNGSDSYIYQISDGNGGVSMAVIDINISAVNDAPDAKNDNFSVTAGQSVTGNLLANNGSGTDTDIEANSLNIIQSSVTTAQGIVVAISANGNFSYTAAPGFTGTDSFTYTLSDGNGGTDTATVTFNVAAPSTITGTQAADVLIGTAGADTMFGLGGNDNISGGAGNDIIDGGTGYDVMTGGNGDDTYFVDIGSDFIVEAVNGGTDTVKANVTYVLANNVENLILTGTADIGGSGNALDNIITGNSGNNTIMSSAGVDTLIGGVGNDIYMISHANSTVVESANEGTDRVMSTVSYVLSNNIEYLMLGGTDAINGTGNGLSNQMMGNANANIIDGGGGADTMMGGGGNDTYFVDHASDMVMEGVDQGTDTVHSSINYTLLTNVENLVLSGTSAINGTGNTADNTVIGNGAINTLTGGSGNDALYGGGGADTLWGNLGADTFAFDSSTAYHGVDTIKDFSIAQGDKINIEDLLAGYDPISEALTDFVQITNSGTNSVISVDRDGLDSLYGWTQIATIQNVTGLTDEQSLANNGILIT